MTLQQWVIHQRIRYSKVLLISRVWLFAYHCSEVLRIIPSPSGNLASADFRKEIDAASKDLYGSLGELQNTYKVATKEKFPLSGDNLAIIATAIDAIGTAIAENKHGTGCSCSCSASNEFNECKESALGATDSGR